LYFRNDAIVLFALQSLQVKAIKVDGNHKETFVVEELTWKYGE
jgi:hypothetical protein